VSLHTDNQNFEEETIPAEGLSEDETEFLAAHKEWNPIDKNKEYDFTVNEPDVSPQRLSDASMIPKVSDNTDDKLSSIDYHTFTIPELKEICREKGLKISAKKKAELVERIQTHERSEKPQVENTITQDLSPEEYLKSLILEYLHASGGQASSRDVGRYLAANKVSYERRVSESRQPVSALAELKEIYGSLNTFVKTMPNFYIVPAQGHEFNVCIEQNARYEPSSRS